MQMLVCSAQIVIQLGSQRNFQMFTLLSGRHPGVEGRGVLNKVKYGEAPPRGPTPYSFIYHFSRKGTPFIYLLLKKGIPFTYLL